MICMAALLAEVRHDTGRYFLRAGLRYCDDLSRDNDRSHAGGNIRVPDIHVYRARHMPDTRQRILLFLPGAAAMKDERERPNTILHLRAGELFLSIFENDFRVGTKVVVTDFQFEATVKKLIPYTVIIRDMIGGSTQVWTIRSRK